ncbi:metallophosphoesterase [Thalassospira sp.]|uniref:metallophosphoesterase family protein n=1 Tax=Thalassospira sp. TaxID=1912094 RepID=UPI0027356478|nr:metallophosphoesterase [Thalassospira sp.]MDP2699760.1 metallophosphoesterase family protein [Thalassospira sp.]
MRILAFSDLHRNQEIARQIVRESCAADILVGAGDFAMRGIGLRDTLDILASADAPLLAVSGNHDSFDELQAICGAVPNFTLLDGAGVNIKGHEFYGISREIPFQKDALWSESYSEEQASNLLAGCPTGAVLISHSPPYGVVDFQADGRHEGSEALLRTVRDKKPRVHLCGHIHHCIGMHEYVGQTKVMNLGPTINWIEL